MKNDDKIMMGHGSGGLMMKRLLEDEIFSAYGGDHLRSGDDAALLTELNLQPGETLAFSTDSFVVTPQFFPGGDLGHLCICGTVNDLATSGAVPKFLSLGMVIEEGYPISDLRKICASIAATAFEAEVEIVTGDTKVVERGACDGLYINTSGIGVVPDGVSVSGSNCRPGDIVIVSGSIADHGMCIMSQRQGLQIDTVIESDAAPLCDLVSAVLDGVEDVADIHALRDPTRGGIASTLNEFAEQSGCDITINEEAIAVKPSVRAMCEMLGLDPCHVANEGKMVFVVAANIAGKVVDILHKHKYGKDACIIGEVAEQKGEKPRVSFVTEFGTTRILDMLSGEQLPRIC